VGEEQDRGVKVRRKFFEQHSTNINATGKGIVCDGQTPKNQAEIGTLGMMGWECFNDGKGCRLPGERGKKKVCGEGEGSEITVPEGGKKGIEIMQAAQKYHSEELR